MQATDFQPLAKGFTHANLMVGVSNNEQGSGENDGWLLVTNKDGSHLPFSIKGRVVYDLNNNCVADPDEPLAAGWFVGAQNSTTRTLWTDTQGEFYLNTGDAETSLNLFLPESGWDACQLNITAINTPAHPVSVLTFLVNPLDGGCPVVNVSITQPDLQRCSTSNFVITVRNQGLVASEPLILDLKLPPEFALVSASEAYTQQGQNLEFSLPAIERLESRNIDISVTLSCLTQLGSTQTVVAQLRPSLCQSPISGPFYTVEGHCEGNNLQFFMENTGEGGAPNPTNYHVLADGLEVAGWQEITLEEGAAPYLLEIPADGRTWRVELQQAPNYEAESAPSATVEGCGVGVNNLYSVEVKNGWRFDEKSPMIGTFQASNTIGASNKIEEAAKGLGLYNIIDHTDWLEYTARYQIPQGVIVNDVTFILRLSSTYKISSFQIVAYSGRVSSVVLDIDNNFRITLSDIEVQPGDYVMLRFMIKPDNPVSSGGINGLMITDGQVLINGVGPYQLDPGFHNYDLEYSFSDNLYYNYPGEILIYGGRGYDFGTCFGQASDGAIYYGGESFSFSYRGKMSGLLIKINPTGEAIWSRTMELDNHSMISIRGIVGLPDNGCIIAGFYLPEGKPLYLNETSAFIARLDDSGNIVWKKVFRPAGDNNGAWLNGLIPTTDGHCVVFGQSESTSPDNGREAFYTKIDIEQGNIIWNGYQNIGDPSFLPKSGSRDSDGHLILLGTDETWGDVIYEVVLKKINFETGEVIWETRMNSQHDIYVSGVAMSNNGTIIVSGTSQWYAPSGEYVTTPTFIRFTSEGNYIDEKNPLVGPLNVAHCKNIINASDGGFFVLGDIFRDFTKHMEDAMLLKIDENAEVQWWKSYGCANLENAVTAIISAPNQLLIGAFNQPRPPFYDLQSMLIRTDLDGNFLVDAPHGPILAQHRIHIFPNPAVDKIWLRCDDLNEPLPWIITDATGRLINQGTLQENLSAVSLGDLPSGIYYLLFPDGTYRSEKIVIKQCR